jgi:hypothetical protein
MMTNKYRLLFKKIDDEVITLTRNTMYKKCYVNKREIEQFMIYRIVAFLLPLTV